MTRGAKTISIAAAVLVAVAVTIFYQHGRSVWVPMIQNVTGKRSVDEVLNSIGPAARARLQPHFSNAALSYPPQQVTLLAMKDKASLELWVEMPAGSVLVRSYVIQALSGVAGPKLREGDRQVPEGIYQIEGLNPNSSYHLSLKLDYPNAFDRQQAQREGRHDPGSNIFIHGKAVSIGCLAMGDDSVEELFVLAADIGRENIQVVIAPTDPRLGPLSFDGPQPWGVELYQAIEKAFQHHPLSAAAARHAEAPTSLTAVGGNEYEASCMTGRCAQIGIDTGISHVRS